MVTEWRESLGVFMTGPDRLWNLEMQVIFNKFKIKCFQYFQSTLVFSGNINILGEKFLGGKDPGGSVDKVRVGKNKDSGGKSPGIVKKKVCWRVFPNNSYVIMLISINKNILESNSKYSFMIFLLFLE